LKKKSIEGLQKKIIITIIIINKLV